MCLVEAKGRSRTASSVSLLHSWSYLINNLDSEAELKTFVKLCLWLAWRTKALDRCALGSICRPWERFDFAPSTPHKNPLNLMSLPVPSALGLFSYYKRPLCYPLGFKRLERPGGGTVEKLWLEWNTFSGGEPVSHWSLNLEILAFLPWEMRCWNQIAEAVLHEWELKKRLKKFKAKFRYIFTIFPSTLTQRIKYSLTEKWKNDFNRIWSEFCNSRIVIYSPESRIVSHKNWEVIEVVMTFRKISIYFDLREGGREK